MADFPALPLWTDALLGDCHHLNDAKFGLYMKILILMWRTPECRVPNDKTWIANKLGRGPLEFDIDIKPILEEFCQNDGNWWTQKRLQKEFKYVGNLSKRQSENAKSKWRKEKDPNSGTNLASKRHRSGNAPTPTPKPHKPPTPLEGGGVDLSDQGQGEIEDAGDNYSPPPPTRSVSYVNSASYDALHFLDDKAIENARKAAPGWDIYYLAGIYNEKIRSGSWKQPQRPDLGFPAWCQIYTKGKKP